MAKKNPFQNFNSLKIVVIKKKRPSKKFFSERLFFPLLRFPCCEKKSKTNEKTNKKSKRTNSQENECTNPSSNWWRVYLKTNQCPENSSSSLVPHQKYLGDAFWLLHVF